MSRLRTVALKVAALDRHLVADGELLLLDLRQVGAVGVLQDERLSQPRRLAVDLEDLVTVGVLDPEVVADGEDLLAHLETLALRPSVAQPHGFPFIAAGAPVEAPPSTTLAAALRG